MFQKLVNHNDDLRRLVEKGYAVAFDSNRLIVRDIPYLDNENQSHVGAIGSPERAEPFIREVLERGERHGKELRMEKEHFAQAIRFFLNVVAQIPEEDWNRTALGVWSVRDLIGHTSRAIALVDVYATEGTMRNRFGTVEGIADRARQAGQALGSNPIATLNRLADRVLSLVERLPDDHIMHTPGGVQELSRYLRTRVTELTIHTLDLAKALGIEAEPPEECLCETLYVLSNYTISRKVGVEVAFALTGRTPLPSGFTVVP